VESDSVLVESPRVEDNEAVVEEEEEAYDPIEGVSGLIPREFYQRGGHKPSVSNLETQYTISALRFSTLNDCASLICAASV
jgi:hypothetical protein